MAVSDFDYDVFITFASVDDLAPVKREEGWISRLTKDLKLRLAQIVRVQPTILCHTDIDFDDFFDVIGRSAVLVAVISPSYVQSLWCRKEFELFIKQAERGPGVFIENTARYFKVLKDPVQADQLSPEMQKVPGYRFFGFDPAGGELRYFDPLLGSISEHGYMETLNDLAQDVADVLAKLTAKKAGVESASRRETEKETGITHPGEENKSGYHKGLADSESKEPVKEADHHIFMSYAREDESFALRLAKMIKNSGISVWVDQWDIPEGSDWDRKIENALYDLPGFLIILSPTSVERDEVRSELRVALNEEKHIFPVLYQECRRTPRQLLLIERTDLTAKGLEDDTVIQSLVLAMKTKLNLGRIV